MRVSKKFLFITCILIAIGIIVFSISQFLILQKAHSTFTNYYAFRGCIKLIERTDTYGICQLASGKTIKIVLFNGKWYLDGDLPYPGLNFL
jgi:hypothetical protein